MWNFFSSFFSAIRLGNISTCRILDFGPCQNLKSHIRCNGTSLSRQKTDLAISKNNWLSIELFVIFCSAVRKLYKLSILSLLISNYSPAYLFIFLFISSIYLFNYTSGGRSLLPNSNLPGWRLLLNVGGPF